MRLERFATAALLAIALQGPAGALLAGPIPEYPSHLSWYDLVGDPQFNPARSALRFATAASAAGDAADVMVTWRDNGIAPALCKATVYTLATVAQRGCLTAAAGGPVGIGVAFVCVAGVEAASYVAAARCERLKDTQAELDADRKEAEQQAARREAEEASPRQAEDRRDRADVARVDAARLAEEARRREEAQREADAQRAAEEEAARREEERRAEEQRREEERRAREAEAARRAAEEETRRRAEQRPQSEGPYRVEPVPQTIRDRNLCHWTAVWLVDATGNGVCRLPSRVPEELQLEAWAIVEGYS